MAAQAVSLFLGLGFTRPIQASEPFSVGSCCGMGMAPEPCTPCPDIPQPESPVLERRSDDGRKFTELYNVQRLTKNTIDPVCRVTICTIQRLFSMLKGDEAFDESLEELSGFEGKTPFDEAVEVGFNPKFPIEMFDFIITDECHRSIYKLWRQVLEYFDAHLIGLTPPSIMCGTPAKRPPKTLFSTGCVPPLPPHGSHSWRHVTPCVPFSRECV